MHGVADEGPQHQVDPAPIQSIVSSLGEIIDASAVQALMDDFYGLTGLLGAVLDLDGRVLVAAGWQDVCSRFHRVHPGTRQNCLESDLILTQGVPRGEVRAYKCRNGMWDIVTPLFVGDAHVGNIFTGQFFYDDEEPDAEFFEQQAERFGFDQEEYLQAVRAVPRFSHARIDALMRFYVRLAEQIAQLGYSKLVLSRTVEDLEKSKESLRESAQLNQQIIDGAHEGVVVYGKDLRYRVFNPFMERMFGRKASEVIGRRPDEVFPFLKDAGVIQRLEQALRGETPSTVEFAYEVNDRVGWIAYTISPIREPDGEIVDVIAIVQDVTERRRSEEALRESEDKFKYLFDRSIVAKSVTKPSGEIQVNDAFSEMLGYTREELVSGTTWQQLTHPDDVAETEKTVASLLSGEVQSGRFAKRYVRKDGGIVWADVSTSLRRSADGTPEYFMTTILDITQRKQAEEELKRAHATLQAAMDQSPAGIAIADAPDGLLRYVNEAGLEMRGADRQTLVDGVDVDAYVPRWHLEDLDGTPLDGDKVPLARAIKFGETTSRELIICRPDGTDRTVIASAAPIFDDAGQVLSAVTVFTDITDRKLAEYEITTLNAQLEQRVQERTEELARTNAELLSANTEVRETNAVLEEATRAKSEFLTSMSHELRTPLNSIIGFSDILVRGLAGALNEEQRKQIGMINSSGRHLLGLVNEVLDLAKIESGQGKPTAHQVDIAAVARTMFDTVKPMADEKGIEMEFVCPDGLPLIETDALQVRQILLNLMSNAVKFTTEGAVTVTVSRDGDGVLIAVKDTGCGIPEEERERIFDEFYQVTPEGGVKTEGTGLGLAVSQRFAESLEGQIEVDSEVGSGSTFKLRLPRSWRR